MKNKILMGLALLVASIGGVYNPLHGMETSEQKRITINGIDYIMTTRHYQYNTESIEGTTMIETLQSEHAGFIKYRIGTKAKTGCIDFLITEPKFRHLGIAEQLILEVGKFFYKNNVTDIKFEAAPFESSLETKNADIQRLVNYYLRIGKKYGTQMNQDEISKDGTIMTATLPSRL